MENALLVLFCALLAYCIFKYFQSPSRPNVPPGPFEWPLIGSRPIMLMSSIYHREQSHVLLTRLARHYGKVFSIGLGGAFGGRVIVLNDYKVIKEAFQKPELSDRTPEPDFMREARGGRGGRHYAAQETCLEGYTIPKGSTVIANLWALHHDPDIWSDPNVFRPSRFLDQDGRAYEDRVDCIPFAIGRRVCLGEMLAKTEIFIFLTHLLYRFSFKKPTASTTLSFEGNNGLTYGPLPYQLRAENAHDVTLGQG